MSDSDQKRTSPAESPSSLVGPARTLLDNLVSRERDRLFLTVVKGDQLEQWTFGDFRALSARFAGIFGSRGVGAGDSVVLLLPQGAELMAAFVGAMSLGAVPAILAYPSLRFEAQKYQRGLHGVMTNIGARLTVVDEDFPAALREAIDTPPGRLLQVRGSDFKRLTPDPLVTAVDPGQLAFLQHSAGTTGLQKGVALTHTVVLDQIRRLAPALGIVPRDRIVSWLPLYHDMGLIACFLLPLVCGLPVVMQSPFEWVVKPSSFLHLIGRLGCTLGWLPNFAFQFMARRTRDEELDQIDLGSIRALVNCSEPIRHQSMEEFQDRFGPCGLTQGTLLSSYALAENTFAVTQSAPGQDPVRCWVDRESLEREKRAIQLAPDHHRATALVSSGKLLEKTSVRIVDDNGRELAQHQVGEILVRSPSLFSGYFNRPELTSGRFVDGFYRTGDVGFLLNSELFVIGRADDTIIVGGRNLQPQDAEEIAAAHPMVQDGRVVAFGLENPQLGTRDLVILAEIREGVDPVSEAPIIREIRRAVLDELGVAPRLVKLVPPRWLVKSTAGKPARAANREKMLATAERREGGRDRGDNGPSG